METKDNPAREPQVQLGALVDASVLDKLRAIAASEDRSIASVIRRAVEREIATREAA